MGLYLIGVRLIDTYFMDVSIPDPHLTNGGVAVDLSRSWVANYEFLR
jgi:hypothetical protein